MVVVLVVVYVCVCVIMCVGRGGAGLIFNTYQALYTEPDDISSSLSLSCTEAEV